jgi:hypothetical protein
MYNSMLTIWERNSSSVLVKRDTDPDSFLYHHLFGLNSPEEHQFTTPMYILSQSWMVANQTCPLQGHMYILFIFWIKFKNSHARLPSSSVSYSWDHSFPFNIKVRHSLMEDQTTSTLKQRSDIHCHGFSSALVSLRKSPIRCNGEWEIFLYLVQVYGSRWKIGAMPLRKLALPFWIFFFWWCFGLN